MDKLKKEVEECSGLLASSDASKVLEGSKQFYDLIMRVWSLDTSLAKDAAELVCDTIRYVHHSKWSGLLQFSFLQGEWGSGLYAEVNKQ